MEDIITGALLGVHILIAVLLVGIVLLQRSEGGALGIGGGTMGGLMSARGAANNITRATAALATCFIATSLALAILAGGDREPRSIIDQPPALPGQQIPAPTGPAVPFAN